MKPTRSLLATIAVLAAATLVVAPGAGDRAAAQTGGRLTLASRYTAQAIDSPTPAIGGQLGWLGIANVGDLDRDGKDDVALPQYDGAGRIHLVSGATGQVIRTILPPDPNLGGSEGTFVYPAALADLGSCPGGQTSQTCPANPIGPPDGVPEVMVGATGVDIGTVVDLGRAYIFDGATGAVLKRVQMPPADLAAETLQAPKSFSFGRSIVSPSSPFDPSPAVRLGDLDGGGRADFVVGNPTYYEAGPATNPSCNPGPCPGAGRVYFYRGEDVAGGDPTAVLDAPFKVIKNPLAQTGATHERFGHAVYPVGDIGRCTSDPGPGAACPAANAAIAPDGRPDVVVAAHQTEFPAGVTAGVVQLFDGTNGSVLRMYEHPQPQSGALYGYAVGTMSTAVGDLGGSTRPDIVVPAVVQNVDFVGQGRGYVLSGDHRAGNPVLSFLNDPTPARGGNFGAPFAGVGDVAGDPLNEVLVGAAGPWSPGDNRSFTGDVHVIDPVSQKSLLALDDPDDQPGSGFGQGAVPMGDLNDDGRLDFAVAAGFYDGTTGLREGRMYIFRSEVAAPVSLPAPVTNGYRLVASDGGVFAFGDAPFLGSLGATRLNQPVVAAAGTPGGRGYWLAAADGGVFAFGDARFLGSMGATRLNRPIVAAAATPTGRGYWLVASDGGVFAFGDAVFLGSMGATRLNQPIVAMAATPTGRGYWLVASDGGVFAFGDALFAGAASFCPDRPPGGSASCAAPASRRYVGIAPTPSGRGYWLAAADGVVLARGDAASFGDPPARLAHPLVAISASPTGRGYRLVAADGGVFALGDARFLGSTGAIRLARPIVAVVG